LSLPVRGCATPSGSHRPPCGDDGQTPGRSVRLFRPSACFSAEVSGLIDTTARGKVGVAARWSWAVGVQHGLDVTSGSEARGVERLALLPAGEGAPEPGLPDRYRIKRDSSGAVLTCVEAPTVSVRVQHGFTVTAGAARSAAPGSIFLDGPAQGEPFIDPERDE